MSKYVLELKNITKTFPGVKALDDVSFRLRPGEIHALMGENGAGKSTFIKIITGVHRPEQGVMLIDGREVHFQSTRESQKMGIACIYQHSTAYPDLSVTENIFLGQEKKNKVGMLDWKTMHKLADKVLKSLGSNINPKQTMGALSVAQQQLVEIAKALSADARIVIMDEPTAALSKQESEDLYKFTMNLKKRGVSVIFISHKLEDMYRLSDRVTVLRDARYIGTWDINDITAEETIIAMVGREIKELFPKPDVQIGEEILRVCGLGKMGLFKDVSFEVSRGEVLGLTGLVGAGRTEVAEAICGINPADEGYLVIDGKKCEINNPVAAENVGIGLLPEDRHKQALILDWEISKNIGLGNMGKFTKRGLYMKKKENNEAQTHSERLRIKASTIFDRVYSLSGGNQQKTVVAKMLTSSLKVIILDEPTKGVDVGAKAAIHEIIGGLAEKGYGIILISSEMPEVLGMADRIVVMRTGRVVAEFDRKEATQEKILESSMVGRSNTAAAKETGLA